jgi:hypothetical protein
MPTDLDPEFYLFFSGATPFARPSRPSPLSDIRVIAWWDQQDFWGTKGDCKFVGIPMSLLDRLIKIVTLPVPIRTVLMRIILKHIRVGSYWSRLAGGAVERPWYGWCLYHAAVEAKLLGHDAMTAIELGVAGGNGLMCLCEHRDEIEKLLKIRIVIQGFDTGTGLPATQDSRDLLYCWPPGSFEMDRNALERRIARRAELVIGDVRETVRSWCGSPEAPLGAVFFDLDYYTSTQGALDLLTKPNVLPRIWCYMDDICGYAQNAYSDSIGVRQAIKDFNLSSDRLETKDHLSQAYAFKGLWHESWHEQIYIYHRLAHPEYDKCLSGTRHQLKLRAI